MIKLKNEAAFFRGIDLWVKRQEDMFLDDFRKLVWAIYVRLLEQTPQYTGLAVVSWNIGVGAPDMTERTYRSDVDPDMHLGVREDSTGRMRTMVVHPANVRHKGDPRAIRIAKERERPKLDLVKRGMKVYFSNTAMGDMNAKVDKRFGHAGPTFYLEALQDKGYWTAKLRAENSPYETVDETVVAVHQEWLAKRGQGFKPGGETWEAST